jgi:YHS domain-containing protein
MKAAAMRLCGPALMAAAVLLSGCNALLAQNPSSPMRPVSAAREGDDTRLMLKGYDVVAYFTQGRELRGSAQFKSDYERVSFYFASAENKALFDLDPKRYQPEYHGLCADGIVYAIPRLGDPTAWRIIDARLFIFESAAAKAAFELDIQGNIALADQYWREQVLGTNSAWQRSKRLIDRVPHYKSEDELAREVAAANAKGA